MFEPGSTLPMLGTPGTGGGPVSSVIDSAAVVGAKVRSGIALGTAEVTDLAIGGGGGSGSAGGTTIATIDEDLQLVVGGYDRHDDEDDDHRRVGKD